ncbi:YjbE family putative metal transport protein [uncultured Sphingomonas sp.]|uniref:YjbE family putative metal transport protein n=1 Tax=uncultured Sphingomonas sp. TaxID=158754 RepID=UPI0035CA9CFC
MDFSDVFTAAGLAALGQVIMIDLMLAGDNIVVLGTLAAGLPDKDRKRVLTIGVAVALVFLVIFAWFATMLLHVVGLLFAGGILLLWVAWKLFRELGQARAHRRSGESAEAPTAKKTKSFAKAAIQVALADLSMSLDNVLAVAGAARDHPVVLLFGLALSVTLMAVAANLIARLIERYHWIAYLGLVVILYVAGSMIHQGIVDPKIGLGQLL